MPKLISEQAKAAKRTIAANRRKVTRVVDALAFISDDKVARALRELRERFPQYAHVQSIEELQKLVRDLEAKEAQSLKQRYNV